MMIKFGAEPKVWAEDVRELLLDENMYDLMVKPYIHLTRAWSMVFNTDKILGVDEDTFDVNISMSKRMHHRLLDMEDAQLRINLILPVIVAGYLGG